MERDKNNLAQRTKTTSRHIKENIQRLIEVIDSYPNTLYCTYLKWKVLLIRSVTIYEQSKLIEIRDNEIGAVDFLSTFTSLVIINFESGKNHI